jgi:hypothetical protein
MVGLLGARFGCDPPHRVVRCTELVVQNFFRLCEKLVEGLLKSCSSAA